MLSRPSAKWRWLVVVAVLWHAFTLAVSFKNARKDRTARDFATYYYAVQVAMDGGDPYDKRALGERAREDGGRRGVHPFFYPPPYLTTMVWVRGLDLLTAYRVWFWLDVIASALVFLLLWRWWRPLGPAVPVVLAATWMALTAIPNNHLMGQMNFPPMLLALWGVWQVERGRDLRGGAAMGLACMLKMSPAFLVMWWLLRRRWRAVGASVAMAVVLTVASLPLVGPAIQGHFYTAVLPGFGSGSYNGLAVGIDLFGNHSLPNLYDRMWPKGPAHTALSDTARWLTTATNLGVVVGVGWTLRRAPADALALAGQVGAVCCAMLLVPVYTYEHHMVWMVPAAVAVGAGFRAGRLPGWTMGPLALAWVAWCFDLAKLKDLSFYVAEASPLGSFALQEAKFVALLVFFAAALWVGRSDAPEGEA